MQTKPIARPGYVPARYIGTRKLLLSRGTGPYYNLDGTLRESRELRYGDEMLMPEREILGQTLLHDPRQQGPSFDLGPGRVTRPEHKEATPQELAAWGYEFHEGRADYELIGEKVQATRAASRTKRAAAEVSRLVLDPSQVQVTEDTAPSISGEGGGS